MNRQTHQQRFQIVAPATNVCTESAPNPIFELRPIPYVWLFYVRGEVMFCEQCPGKCLAEHIDGSAGAVAHACRRKSDLKRFGAVPAASGKRLSFRNALVRVGESGARMHPGERLFLAVHEFVSGELTSTVFEVFSG